MLTVSKFFKAINVDDINQAIDDLDKACNENNHKAAYEAKKKIIFIANENDENKENHFYCK